VIGPEHPYPKRFGISILLVVALVAVTIALNGVASAASPLTQQHSTKTVATNADSGRGGSHGSLVGGALSTGAGVRPRVVLVQSRQLTLQPGQSTYDIDRADFRAVCPTGYTVLGTGFNASVGTADFVQSYGTFVGGLIANDSGVQSSPVFLQATCGVVAGGVSMAPTHASATGYQTMLEQAAALRR
jgi:hypothetical protein